MKHLKYGSCPLPQLVLPYLTTLSVWIFSNLPNPSGRTMALESTQPLTEMSTRNLKKETWG
jgi:hypothetical protein